MEQENERTDPADNIMRFNDTLRRRRTSAKADEPRAQPAAERDGGNDPPPDAA